MTAQTAGARVAIKTILPGLLLLLFAGCCHGADIPLYGYQVLRQIPHSREDFVQGLELRDGKLYQGTGLRGRSALQVFDFSNGALLRSRSLAQQYFGEGITVLNDQVVQLTWQARRAFVYRRDTLEPSGEFALPGEGWGLTNNGERLIYSDGTNLLRFIDPASWQVTGSVAVTAQGRAVRYLNELEWTPDYLLANVWQSDNIVMIDLHNGAVIGLIDLQGLLPRSERHRTTGGLNGIARNPADGSLWLTGKNWPWLYQVTLLPKMRQP